RAFVIAAAAMVVLALPLRAVQVDRLVGPLARADRYVQSQEAEVVLVDWVTVWFGRELVRHHPLRDEAPRVLGLQFLTVDQLERICGQYSVQFVDYFDLARFEVLPIAPSLAGQVNFSGHDAELRALATSPRCSNR
ncbi:MAG: hypothetical protein HKM95_06385, partial [Inquilinus sp.]|nr:hypothetical protein [Inquilinus sp.]